MTPSFPFKKAVGVVTLFCFLTGQILWAASEPGILLSSLSPSFLQIEIPNELASLDEVYEAPAHPDSRLILHIQNAHGQYDAQIQIKKLLEHLHQKYGFSLIFAEGAMEKLNPAYLELFAEKERNLSLADRLAQQGELTGVEYFMMERPEGVEALGIEKTELYRQNYEAFKAVYSQKDEIEAGLSGIEQNLETLSSWHFSNDMRRVLSEWAKFEKGHRDFLPFVKQLARDAQKIIDLDLESLFAQVEWPQITRLLVIQSMESDLDRDKAEEERLRLIQFLREKRVSKEVVGAIEKLNEKRVTMVRRDDRSRRLEDLPRYLLERLVEEAGPKGFYFHDYPAFSLWAGYLILQNELDSKALYEEIERVFEKVLDQLAVSEREKNLLELYRDTGLLRKLMLLELSRKEWERAVYRKDWIKPEVMQGRLEKIRNEMEGEKGRMGERENGRSPLTDLFATAFSFYDFARQREDVFFQIIEREMALRKSEKAVLVTGGFHTSGLMDLFRERQINYGVLTPRIRTLSDTSNYVSAMLENKQTIFDLAQLEMANTLQSAEILEAAGRNTRSEARHILNVWLDEIQGSYQPSDVEHFNQSAYAQDRAVQLIRSKNRSSLEVHINGKSMPASIAIGQDGIPDPIARIEPQTSLPPILIRQIADHTWESRVEDQNFIFRAEEVNSETMKTFEMAFQKSYSSFDSTGEVDLLIKQIRNHQRLQEGDRIVFLIEENSGQLAGFYHKQQRPRDGNMPHLQFVSVAQDYRGTGAAHVLFEDFAERILENDRKKTLSLYVVRDSGRATQGNSRGTIEEVKAKLGILSDNVTIETLQLESSPSAKSKVRAIQSDPDSETDYSPALSEELGITSEQWERLKPVLDRVLDSGSRLLERYSIEKFAGSGLETDVYQLRDRQTKKEVALKIAGGTLWETGAGVSRSKLATQLRTLQKLQTYFPNSQIFEFPRLVADPLRHPVAYSDGDDEDEEQVDALLVEWLEGQTLQQALDEGAYTAEQLVSLFRSFVRALADKDMHYYDVKEDAFHIRNGKLAVRDIGLIMKLSSGHNKAVEDAVENFKKFPVIARALAVAETSREESLELAGSRSEVRTESTTAKTEEWIRETVSVTKANGVHARVASAIVQKANEFSDTEIVLSNNEQRFNARSILELLKAGISANETIDVEVRGAKAQEALNAIVKILTVTSENELPKVALSRLGPTQEDFIFGVFERKDPTRRSEVRNQLGTYEEQKGRFERLTLLIEGLDKLALNHDEEKLRRKFRRTLDQAKEVLAQIIDNRKFTKKTVVLDINEISKGSVLIDLNVEGGRYLFVIGAGGIVLPGQYFAVSHEGEDFILTAKRLANGQYQKISLANSPSIRSEVRVLKELEPFARVENPIAFSSLINAWIGKQGTIDGVFYSFGSKSGQIPENAVKDHKDLGMTLILQYTGEGNAIPPASPKNPLYISYVTRENQKFILIQDADPQKKKINWEEIIDSFDEAEDDDNPYRAPRSEMRSAIIEEGRESSEQNDDVYQQLIDLVHDFEILEKKIAERTTGNVEGERGELQDITTRLADIYKNEKLNKSDNPKDSELIKGVQKFMSQVRQLEAKLNGLDETGYSLRSETRNKKSLTGRLEGNKTLFELLKVIFGGNGGKDHFDESNVRFNPFHSIAKIADIFSHAGYILSHTGHTFSKHTELASKIFKNHLPFAIAGIFGALASGWSHRTHTLTGKGGVVNINLNKLRNDKNTMAERSEVRSWEEITQTDLESVIELGKALIEGQEHYLAISAGIVGLAALSTFMIKLYQASLSFTLNELKRIENSNRVTWWGLYYAERQAQRFYSASQEINDRKRNWNIVWPELELPSEIFEQAENTYRKLLSNLENRAIATAWWQWIEQSWMGFYFHQLEAVNHEKLNSLINDSLTTIRDKANSSSLSNAAAKTLAARHARSEMRQEEKFELQNAEQEKVTMDEARQIRLSKRILDENERLKDLGFGKRGGRLGKEKEEYLNDLEKELWTYLENQNTWGEDSESLLLSRENKKEAIRTFLHSLIRMREGMLRRLERDGFLQIGISEAMMGQSAPISIEKLANDFVNYLKGYDEHVVPLKTQQRLLSSLNPYEYIEDLVARFNIQQSLAQHAAVHNPKDPDGFIQQVLKETERLIKTYGIERSLAQHAAVGYPKDPDSFIQQVLSETERLMTAYAIERGLAQYAAVGYPKDPDSFIQQVLKETERL
ncbi:MAG: HPr family phosphocarrier protein, partial [Candidatus Omnitrophica bacterium]|nr:HPr family phosphocarrier protein [Candidatus Omnitrophota bacterium]